MMPIPWMNRMLLGRGGGQGGVAVLEVEPAPPRIAQTIGAEDSVYAIDLDMVEGTIALGTRSGRIDILAAAGEGRLACRQTLALGRSLLDLCWLGKSLLAASDSGGRVSLWQRESQNGPRPRGLDVGDDRVGALTGSDERLIGLTGRGRILQWTLPYGEKCAEFEAPPPPGKLSLLRLRPSATDGGILVYPSARGELVLVRPQERRTLALPAHPGGFWVACPIEQGVITIGSIDGTLKVWRPAGRGYQLQRTMAAPVGFISGQALPDEQHFLLIRADGRAGLYALGGDRLELESTVEGEGYRIAAGPPVSVMMAWRAKQRASSAQSLRDRILTRINQGDTRTLEPDLDRLGQLGHPGMALQLRAQAAGRAGDLVAELAALHQLSQQAADCSVAEWLPRYAELLEQVCLFGEALAIQQRLEDPRAIRRLTDLAAAVDQEAVVLEPLVPLAVAIKAATVVGRPCNGLWAAEESTPRSLGRASLSAADVADEYESVRTRNGDTAPAAAEVTVLRWLSPRGLQHRQSILFRFPSARSSPRRPELAMALHVYRDGPETIVVRSLLLSVAPAAAGVDARDHNQSLLEALQWLARSRDTDPHLRACNRTLALALRSLRTRAASPWFQPVEATS